MRKPEKTKRYNVAVPERAAKAIEREAEISLLDENDMVRVLLSEALLARARKRAGEAGVGHAKNHFKASAAPVPYIPKVVNVIKKTIAPKQ